MARKKKTYNPFTMRGSYVGGFSTLILEFLRINLLINNIEEAMFISIFFYPLIKPFNYLVALGNTGQPVNIAIAILGNGFMLFAYGFLIGWGIHSLIRRLRK